jgi:hypothetical protein
MAIGREALRFHEIFEELCRNVVAPALERARGNSPYGQVARVVIEPDGLTTLSPSGDFSRNAKISLRLDFGPQLSFVGAYPGIIQALLGAGGTPCREFALNALTEAFVEQEATAFLRIRP